MTTRKIIGSLAEGDRIIEVAVDRWPHAGSSIRAVDLRLTEGSKRIGFHLTPDNARKIGMRLIAAADEAGGAA